MEDTRIILSGLWVATMLTYLLGDVLRIFAGDHTPGELMNAQATQGMWLGIAVIMLIPIVMLVLTLTLPHPAIRWGNIVVAIVVVIFNVGDISALYVFYGVVEFLLMALIVWHAWKWPKLAEA